MGHRKFLLRTAGGVCFLQVYCSLEIGNWVYGDNNRVVRIQRWLRLKNKCLELGYPVVEKATEHLLMELEKYGETPITHKMYDHYNENPGSMDRND